jgi:hypothetical protein
MKGSKDSNPDAYSRASRRAIAVNGSFYNTHGIISQSLAGGDARPHKKLFPSSRTNPLPLKHSVVVQTRL